MPYDKDFTDKVGDHLETLQAADGGEKLRNQGNRRLSRVPPRTIRKAFRNTETNYTKNTAKR